MSVKRLLGGVIVAVIVAVVMSQTVGAVKMECLDGWWWVCW